jgi:hypothetical protein
VPGFEIFGKEEKEQVLEVLESGVLFRYEFAAQRKGVWKVLEFEKADGSYVKGYYGKMLRHPFSGVWICSQAGLPVEVLHIVAVHSKEGDGGHRSIEANIIFHCDFANFEPFKDLCQ